MPAPTPPIRLFSFTDHSTNNPNAPQPGVSLDAEFNQLITSATDIIARINLIQRDDGALQNGSVTLDTLAAGLYDQIVAAVAPDLSADILAAQNAAAAALGHASNASLSAVDAAASATSAAAASTAAETAQTAAESARNAAQTSESNAAASSTGAGNSANLATTQANTATTQADRARDWAIKLDFPVESGEQSAKWHAVASANSAADAETSAITAAAQRTAAEAARDAAVAAEAGVAADAVAAEAAASAATSAKNDAETAELGAQAAQTAAVSARTAAETAETNAAASAASASTDAGTATAQATAAEDWAIKTPDPVQGGEFSAKKHAQDASTDAAAAQGSASSAATSESNAAASASSAQDSATTAEAARDATLAAGGGTQVTQNLLDVSNTPPDTDGQVLVWDNTAGLYVPGAVQGGAGVPPQRGVLRGLTLSNNIPIDLNHDIDIAPGAAMAGDGSAVMELPATIRKRLDVAFSEGNGQGGMVGSGLTANTTVFVHLIGKDDGTVDVATTRALLSLPTGFTRQCYIGALRTDASSNIRRFKQTNNVFLLDPPVVSLNLSNPGTTGNLAGLTVPSNVDSIVAIFSAVLLYSGSEERILGIWSGNLVNEPALGSPGLTSLVVQGYTNSRVSGQFLAHVNSTGRIRYKLNASDSSTVVRIATDGWIDYSINKGARF